MALYVDIFKSHSAPATIEALAGLEAELVTLPSNTTPFCSHWSSGSWVLLSKAASDVASAKLTFLQKGSHLPLRELIIALKKTGGCKAQINRSEGDRSMAKR